MKMINCKICGNQIRITSERGKFFCSCGSISCDNIREFGTLKKACLYAEELYGKTITELKWEGTIIKHDGRWLI